METSSVDYICAVMRRLGMIAVRIEFSGAGDSGNVDDLTWEGMCDLAKTPVTADELERAAGCPRLALGPHVLRAVTAPVAAVAALSARISDGSG